MADPAGTGGPSRDDIKNAEDLNKEYSEMRNTLRSISFAFKSEINEQVAEMEELTGKIVKNIGVSLNREIQDSVKLTRILADTEKGVGKSLTTQVKVKEQIKVVEQRRSSIIDLINEAESEGLFLTSAMKKLQEDLLITLNKQDDALQRQLNKVIKFEKLLGPSGIGGLLTGIAKIPILGQFVKAEEILKKMREEADKGSSKLKIYGAGFDTFFKSAGMSMIGLIIPALKFIVDSVLQLNQKAFDLAKNLGTSADQGERLTKEFTQIANTSANAGLTGKDLAKTFTELSNTVGYLVPSTAQFAESATLIQKRIGASAEDMAVLARQSALNGQTLEQTYATISASRAIEGSRNKLALTNKQILDGIAKTSAATVINFKGSTEALANAVVRATKLGTTLNDISKQGESLLDFETSIQKEFELQVLTGRQVNLTRARELALMGNTAGLMEELNNQQVTYDSFMGENVIQRKAEADAIGLSVEELSKKLLAQKQANILGAKEGQSLQERYGELMKTAAGQKLIKEQLTLQEQADLRRASMQEKFQAAMERLKDTLGSILAGPVGKMIEAFAKFVGDTKRMTELGNTLKSIFDFIGRTIERFPQILSSVVSVMKVLVSLSIARAVASIVASLSTVPVLGVAAGIGAGVAAYNWLDGLAQGGGSGAPSITTPSADAGMTQPVSPITANQQAQVPAPAAATTATNTNPNFNLYIDGQPVYASVRRNFETDPGLKKS